MICHLLLMSMMKNLASNIYKIKIKYVSLCIKYNPTKSKDKHVYSAIMIDSKYHSNRKKTKWFVSIIFKS